MESIYLKKLKFDQKLQNSFIFKYLTNIRFVFLILFALIPMGIFSLMSLPRRLNPEVNLPFISIQTVLPGANPEEIENIVTIPIEDAIENIDGISNIESISQENVSIVQIEFQNNVDPENARQRVQSAVETIGDFPEDATSPKVEAFDIEDQPVITFAISADADSATLNTISDDIKNSLEEEPDIDRVETFGLTNTKIEVYINENMASTYGINPLQLTDKINNALSTLPAGSVETDYNNFSLSLDKQVTSLVELRNMPVNIDGNVIPLSFLAEVSEVQTDKEEKSYIYKNDDFENAVVFNVYRTSKASITKVTDKTFQMVDKMQKDYPVKINFHTIQSGGQDIKNQFDELFKSFFITLALVFTTLFIFLGLRQSSIVSLSIPITFLISFSVMLFTGLSLNFLTVFSLLLALGLLVDDAIVIISAMTSYMRTKKFSAKEAGMLVWNDFIIPIWSTTITTVWAFIPLLLATGIIGEFIKTIPIVVSTTLIASTSVAVLITLPFIILIYSLKIPKRVILTTKISIFIASIATYAIFVPKAPILVFILGIISLLIFLLIVLQFKLTSKRKLTGSWKNVFQNGLINSESIQERYRKIITSILKSKKSRRSVAIGVIIFSILSYLLVPLGFVKNEFFPKTNANILYINLEMPNGTKASILEREAKEITKNLKLAGGVEEILLETQKGASNQAQISLRLDEDKISSIELAQELRDQFDFYSKGTVTITELSGGPPAGADIETSILGEDLSLLQEYSQKVVNYLESRDDIAQAELSVAPSTSKLVFKPNYDELASRQISISELGLWLKAYAGGLTVDTATINDDKKEIVFNFKKSNLSLQELNTIYIPTRSGDVPLFALGNIEPESNPTFINRLNGKRKITVTAGVVADASSTEINTELEKFISDDLNLPEGYTTATGGVNQENEESVNSIIQAMALSALLILATMVIQLGSYRKALIILLVIPLAVSGVFVLFAITRTPLSFPALIGVLALFGIVVNNSIVVVEKINQNLRIGIKFDEAIADAAASRVEPILFSSVTTIMGLVPITITDPLWRGLGGAIIAGLSVSGTIMLLFIPVVYYMWFRAEHF